MMAPFAFSKGRGTRPFLGGVGAQPSLICGWDIPTVSCPDPKCPKNKQTKNETNERRQMEQQQIFNKAEVFLRRAFPLLAIAGLTAQLLLTGCASVNRREETIDSILEKENALIEKVKLERTQPEVSQGVSQNEDLKKAEAHLVLALDELLKANEVIQLKLIKQNETEVHFERSARGDR